MFSYYQINMKNIVFYINSATPICVLIFLISNAFGADISISNGTIDYKYFDSIDGNITVTNVTVDDLGNVKLTAGETVKLKTGFQVNEGSLFHARILRDPKSSGDHFYSTKIYASTGNQKITRYDDALSTVDYPVSRRLDISDFFNSVNSSYWTFGSDSVPLNGIVKVPTGNGSFPLAIFVHGNHDPTDYSDEGYEYLCELLASNGIIAATIDENFLNGGSNENDARAIVLLEHVKQFKIWDNTIGHPLYGKVNLNKIMIVGHSRGGEAAGHASYFNTLSSVVPYSGGSSVALDGSDDFGPYDFSLRSVIAIAPTDGQYEPVAGVQEIEDNYFVIHGSRDGDVWTFDGYNTYDRAHAIISNPVTSAVGFKALAWIHGANHNYFNSTWNNEGAPTLNRTEQENVAKVYIGSLAQALLLNLSGYLELIKDHEFGKGWLPSTDSFVSQYQPRERHFINHYEEDFNIATLSPPNLGSNSSSGITLNELFLNSWYIVNEETYGVELTWTSSGGYYQTSLSSGLDATDFEFLALRVGQTNNTTYNTLNTDQDFTIEVQDGSSNSANFPASSVSQLIYPDTGGVVAWAVMQTIRIPLRLIEGKGVDISDIDLIKIKFDQTSSGRIFLDELQLSN